MTPSELSALLVLATVSSFTPGPNTTLSTAMAANHGLAIVYANFCGAEGDITYVGGSVIAGPHGEILALAGKTPTLLVAEIPPRDPSRLSTQSADLKAIK